MAIVDISGSGSKIAITYGTNSPQYVDKTACYYWFMKPNVLSFGHTVVQMGQPALDITLANLTIGGVAPADQAAALAALKVLFPNAGASGGSVTSVSVVTANGFSGSVADPTGAAAITINGLGVLTRTVITSGSSSTVSSGNRLVTFDPGSVLASYTLTMAAAPNDQDVLEIEAGGTVTGGNPVVTALSILANAGQTLVQVVAPTTMDSGEYIRYRYRTANTSWYRLN